MAKLSGSNIKKPKHLKQNNAESDFAAELDSSLGGVDYWRSYKLSRDPFEEPLDENDKTVVELTDTATNIDLINHLLHFNNVLICVTGPKGVGKTTFLNEYMKSIDSNAVFAHKTLGGPKLTPEQLVSLLNYAFEVSIPEADNTEQQLETQVETLQFLDQQSLLIIDDAHLLPPATLAALLEMIIAQSEDQMNLHIVLLGDDELKAQLAKLTKADKELQELYHLLTIEPLNQSAMENYLKEYLLAAGLSGDFPLTHQQLSKIWGTSQGVPGRINNVTKQIMMSGKTNIKGSSGLLGSIWRDNKKSIIGGIIVLIAFIAVSIFTATNNDENSNEAQLSSQAEQTIKPPIPTSVQQVTTKASLPSIREKQNNKPAAVTAKAHIEPAMVSKQLPLPPMNAQSVTPAITNAKQDNNELTPKMVRTDKQTENTDAPSPYAKPNLMSSHTTAAATKNSQGLHTENLIANKALIKAINQNKKIAEAESEARRLAPSVTPVKPEHEQPIKSSKTLSKPTIANKTAAANETTVASKPKTAKRPSLYTTAEQSLLKTPASRFSIQLMAAIQPVSLRQLYNKGITTKIYEYRAKRRGKLWYIAVTGAYRSRAAARNGIRRLPRSIARHKPWIKSYKDIHRDIKSHH